jgi:8-oxo-dGTP pyrophosphatase MutT (NUDIX family)
MDKNKPKLIKRKLRYDGKAFAIYSYRVKLGNEILTRDILERDPGVVIVPIFDNLDVLLIVEYCAGSNTTVLSLPGGSIHSGEKPRAAAYRELKEETGLSPRKLLKLHYAFSHPSTSNRRSHTFLAYSLKGIPHGAEEEHVEVLRVTLDKALDLVSEDFRSDVSTIGSLLLAREKLKAIRRTGTGMTGIVSRP